MKKVFASLVVMTLLATACTKESHGADDAISTSRHGGVEDNPNGGGGNNVPSTTVPAAVMSAFKTRFPNATRIEWKKQSDGNFKVEFFIGAVKYQAIYKPNGSLVKLEHD